MHLKKIALIWLWIIAGIGMSLLYASDVSYPLHYELDYDQHYNRLLDRALFTQLDHSAVYRVQQDLAAVYHQDLNWKRDIRLSQQPLSDGVIGPVTLFWLQRFAHDFRIEPIGDYVDDLINRLEKIAEFSNLFPEETMILLSADFAEWNDTEPSIQRDLDYDIRRFGSFQALLDLVYRYRSLNELFYIPGMADDSVSSLFYYQLTQEDFKLLQSKTQIMAALQKLENKQFENFSLLEEAVSGVLQTYPNLFQRLLPAIQKYYRNKPFTITKAFIAFLNQAMMGDPHMAALNNVIAGLLETELVDIAYPAQTLFDHAAQAKIIAALGVCTASLHNQYTLSLIFSDEDFLALEKDLLNNQTYHNMPEIRKHLKLIRGLRQRSGACNETEQQDVNAFVSNLYANVVQPAIAFLYQKRPVFDTSATFEWDGSGCGCVLDKLSGTVYGFYPYWLADNEKQTVDFSVLTRVAYYGLSFDTSGSINHANDDKSNFDLKRFLKKNPFVQAARKHDSKVDWVIHKDRYFWDKTWGTLDSSQKANIFAKLSDDIFQLLTRTLDADYAKWTFGILPTPTQGDGVTFDFRGYPKDAVSIDLLNRFYDELTKRLNTAGNDYFVNIMVTQSELDEGFYRFTNLLERMTGIQPNDAPSSYQQLDIRDDLKSKILVLLEEPVTMTKKDLRLRIENGGLYGILRGLLLRNVIPVIEFDGHNWEQLEDDIVYFKDNFGGAGFWSMPLNEPAMPAELSGRCSEIQTIGGCLVRHFQQAERDGQPDSLLDQFVCENRHFFWTALMILAVLSFILLVSYQCSCRFYGKNKNLYFMVIFVTIIPALIVALLLLLYDPMLETLAEGNIPLIVVISGGILASIVFYLKQQSQRKRPTRPKQKAVIA
ncbi:hypothetical protein SAMN05216302_1002152 [Nitrosomonas aestuarii]|uniref:Uncharacterized protein n=1 Tax=Nitrosomonas aestuarii TaxID=52441 RepID=A0A1I3Y0Q4_9PROT|nr:hypothetical protein [Nitrosomonas aestuarii]SFK24816.1 hypothetical protein SAMN05216302_1002152 [Nitrosomonas aestuarii]